MCGLETFGVSLEWDSDVEHLRFGLISVLIIMSTIPFLDFIGNYFRVGHIHRRMCALILNF